MIERYNQQTHYSNEFTLTEFFTRTFSSFERELNHLAPLFYKDNNDLMFECIERQWIGVLNNAIIKEFGNEVATLQEYSVPIATKKYGRADYLVRWKDMDLLFEGKMYEECGQNYTFDSMEQEYMTIIEQANKYIPEFERVSYKKDLFFIAIYFGWIRKKAAMEKAEEYMRNILDKLDTTDFCVLFKGNSSGVWVYGRVIRK